MHELDLSIGRSKGPLIWSRTLFARPWSFGWAIMNHARNITPINKIKVGGEWHMITHGHLEDSLQNIPRSFLGPHRSLWEKCLGERSQSLALVKRESKRWCQLTEESFACHQKDTSRNNHLSFYSLKETWGKQLPSWSFRSFSCDLQPCQSYCFVLSVGVQVCKAESSSPDLWFLSTPLCCHHPSQHGEQSTCPTGAFGVAYIKLVCGFIWAQF